MMANYLIMTEAAQISSRSNIVFIAIVLIGLVTVTTEVIVITEVQSLLFYFIFFIIFLFQKLPFLP